MGFRIIPIITLPVSDWTRFDGGGPSCWRMKNKREAERWQLTVNHWDAFPNSKHTELERQAILEDS